MALDALRLAGILEHQAQYDGQTDYKHSAAASLRSMHAEIEQLRLAEEGAKEAFGHVVQQKRELEAECKRLRGLLDGAYDTIRRNAATHNAIGQGSAACGASPAPQGCAAGNHEERE